MSSPSSTTELHFPDGSKNVLQFFAANDLTSPVFWILPAMGVKAAYYRHFAARLNQENWNVVLMDYRGHGLSDLRPSRNNSWGYQTLLETEWPEALAKIKQHFPKAPLFLMGHSLGGQIGSMFLAANQSEINGMVLNASCSVYHKGWGKAGGTGLLAFVAFCSGLSQVLGYYPGHRVGFGGKEAKGIIGDWKHTAFTGQLKAKGSLLDYGSALIHLKHPVLALSYEGDSSAPPAALKELLALMPRANHSVHHITPPKGSKKYNHYSFVKQPELSIPYLRKWLQQQEIR